MLLHCDSGRRKQGTCGGLPFGKQPGAWTASVTPVATAPHSPHRGRWGRACSLLVCLCVMCYLGICRFPLANDAQLRAQLAQMPGCMCLWWSFSSMKEVSPVGLAFP